MNRRAPLFVGIAFVLVAILAYFFVIAPKMKEVDEAESRLEAVQNEEDSLRLQLQRLEAARDQAPETRRELAQLRRRIPPVADLPGIINLFQDAADASGVDFFSISPGDPEPPTVGAGAGQASEIPASVRVDGSFFAVDEFLFRLETLKRAAKVIAIDVGGGPLGLPQISATLDVRLYTTDLDAGPGAALLPAPGVSPTPGASPSPGATPTPGISPAPGETAVPTETPGV